MPNAKKANAIVNRLIEHDARDFEKPGNKMCREAYQTFPMPWDMNPKIEGFSPENFERLEWDRGGELSDGEHFFLGDKLKTMDEVYESLVTNSMITRWREANRDKLNTEEDVAVKAMGEIRELVEREKVMVGRDCVLLLFKES